jgi:RNA polymerase sigma-70 factor (ECF subfamily)
MWCSVTDRHDEVAGWIRRLAPESDAASTSLPSADAALIARLKSGDEVTFRECYDTHYVPLWRYAFRLLGSRDAANDVVQEVFFSLFTQREKLAVRSSVRTYLFGAVRHAALNLLRHDAIAHRLVAVAPTRGDTPAMGAPSSRPDDDAEQHDIEARVMRALAMLPERQRSAMILRWEHGLTTAQIARTLGIADTVAGRLLMKAALHLRRLLADVEP